MRHFKTERKKYTSGWQMAVLLCSEVGEQRSVPYENKGYNADTCVGQFFVSVTKFLTYTT